ncbi:MAG: hypothetical protein K6G62_05755 [Eubacterium sp.]|nr:hypothetical protein [Eubacterium sp.]
MNSYLNRTVVPVNRVTKATYSNEKNKGDQNFEQVLKKEEDKLQEEKETKQPEPILPIFVVPAKIDYMA